jgi:hypothetical protein
MEIEQGDHLIRKRIHTQSKFKYYLDYILHCKCFRTQYTILSEIPLTKTQVKTIKYNKNINYKNIHSI